MNEKPSPSPRLTGLLLLARFHGLAGDADQLLHEFASGDGVFDDKALVLAGRKLGLTVKLTRVTAARAERHALPALGLRGGDGAFILGKISEGRALIQKLPDGRPETVSLADLYAGWDGRVLLVASRASVLGELAKFDFTWFIPVVIRYRRLLGEVLLVSLVVQLLALFTPMLFQVVMDKVLVNNSLATLQVVAAGLACIAVFEALLTTLRSYVFAHTTSRMDVELGSRLFRHLLALPISYFHARRAGDTVARVRELENIRSFLTGNALTLTLDCAFSVVFIAVMFHYSVTLALIVVGSLPVYFLISLLFTPTLRRRLDEKFRRNAENQSLLVETVNGIDTVKSMAVEPQWSRQWDGRLADYVSSGMKTTTIGLLASGLVNFTGKLVNVGTLFFGAQLVIDGKLTVGQLVAFNMLAGQVSGPIIRIAQLWNDFQQVGISVGRLGDILNIRTEIAGTKTALPPIKGGIRFDGVVFRYKPDAPEVLKDVSLDIAAGEIVGIVGRSGSGKSTLTKLVQRLYLPEKGRVMVDDIDLALVEASSLRRQIGVVLQENMLFNRTIRENIALTEPAAPLERVIAMAKLAGAHEFVCELPQGYDTPVGENGVGLSGGQRQRIAIARALMTNPRILIFDEATSALDLESESIIQKNMKAICAGRTVLIIAHRLSAVRDAHRIVVVDKGRIIESGPHEKLLGIPGGVYATLHGMQRV